MVIRDEEVFFIDRYGNRDSTIVYVPLRSFLAVIKKELADAIVRDDSVMADAFFEHIKKKSLHKTADDMSSAGIIYKYLFSYRNQIRFIFFISASILLSTSAEGGQSGSLK